MAWSYARRRQRVLIVSSHPLFGQGLRSLLQERVAPRGARDVRSAPANFPLCLTRLSDF